MGLADVLKRKISQGGGQAKRPCAAAPPPPPATAEEAVRRRLANGGFAALSASAAGKGTRTARRKQRKAEEAAKAAAEEAARAAALQLELQQQQGGGGSDSEDEAADGLANGLAHAAANGHAAPEEGGEEEAAAVPAPYSRLLGALRSGGGAFADALQQRAREQAGDSDASEEEDDGEDEEEEEDDEELGSELEEEEEEEEGSEGEEGAGAGADDGRLGSRLGSGGDGEEAGAAADDSDDGSGNSGSEGEDEEEQAAVAAQQRQHLGLAGDGAAAGSEAAAAAPEDHYAQHFDGEVGEEAAAALLDEKRRTRYLECRPAGQRATGAAGGSQGGEQGPAVAPDVLRQWPGAALQAAPGTRLPQAAPADLAAYGVKERLATRWREVAGPAAAAPGGGGSAGAGAAGAEGDFVSGRQRALFALLSSYCDLLLPVRPYPAGPAAAAGEAPDPELDAVLLHVLSHCAKAADRIRRNNERLKAAAGGAAPGLDAVPKDQGFTRAKVLLLLPQRNLALRAVRRLCALAVRETRTDTIQNKQRLEEEFGDGGIELSERERAAVARKPAEHQALFGGNTDDHFRLGVKLTRGAVKLFADFYDSDIIVASPLALATRLAENAGDEGAADFLSSVEVLVAERADVLLMQNWAHLLTVVEALNRIPRDGHGVDMMRVRDWALSGRGALYRQTVLLGSFASAEMGALLARGCRNRAGSARLWPAHAGVLGQVIPQARQIFERLPAPADGASPAADADARFEHFKRVLWPRIKESGRGGGTLLYIPSYFDYVRVRNFLRSELASFLGLCEYTDRSDAARARAYFFDRRKQVLLYTERAQFYNRHRLRGARAILFYQLPQHPQFYAELLNLLEEGEVAGEPPTVTAVFSKFDALRLERVVGSARAQKMLKARKTGTFLFC